MARQNSTPTAIVTGGSRGIGRAIVGRLATEGYTVAFSYASNAAAAKEVEAEERSRGHSVRGFACDQADVDAIGPFFEQAVAALDGRLDVFVGNAGIIVHAPLAGTSREQFERVLAVNLRGTFFMLQAAARHVAEGGRIVCISTMGTRWPSAGEAAYLASKGGIEQLCRVASRELGPRNISVNCISPGPTDTDMLRDLDEQGRQGVAGMTAMGRLGTPDDVASAVANLVAPSAVWITGQVIRADGGLT